MTSDNRLAQKGPAQDFAHPNAPHLETEWLNTDKRSTKTPPHEVRTGQEKHKPLIYKRSTKWLTAEGCPGQERRKPLMQQVCKAQTWTLDIISTAIIITFLIILIMGTIVFIVARWNTIETYNSMYTTAVFASESLVSSPGVPENWEMLANGSENRIISFGIASERNTINPKKLERMQAMSLSNYTMLRQKLASTRNNVYINISSIDKLTTHAELGIKPQNNQSIYFDRLAILNETAVIVKVAIWR